MHFLHCNMHQKLILVYTIHLLVLLLQSVQTKCLPSFEDKLTLYFFQLLATIHSHLVEGMVTHVPFPFFAHDWTCCFTCS